MVEASLLRNRTHRCSAHHADNAPASPGKTSKMNKIAPAPRASTLNSLRGCRSRHWQTTLHPCADQKHASCRLERMRFAGWSLRLDRCNSCLPLDTELHKMTRHQRALDHRDHSLGWSIPHTEGILHEHTTPLSCHYRNNHGCWKLLRTMCKVHTRHSMSSHRQSMPEEQSHSMSSHRQSHPMSSHHQSHSMSSHRQTHSMSS